MLKRNAAVLLVATLVLGVAAYAWAQEDPSGPTVTDEQGQPAQPGDAQQPGQPHRGRHHPGPGALLGRAVHGDLLVQTDDGFETVTFDRGKVTAVDEDSITIERADGRKVTKAIDDTTRFGPNRTYEDIEVGQGALVVSKGDTARAVLQPPKDRPWRQGQGEGRGPGARRFGRQAPGQDSGNNADAAGVPGI